MIEFFKGEQRRDLIARGFSRRDFGRLAALLSAGSALPFYNEAALAQDIRAIGAVPSGAVRINANENPMGPCREAAEAIHKIVEQGGRYLFQQAYAFVEAMADAEGLPASHVMPFAGSSDPLHRSVVAFASPDRPLVTADPGYESPELAARYIGADVVRVPLREDYSHDPQGMVKAHPNAGVIYVCNPNNPTGTVTRDEDLQYIVANMPRGCILLLDEAYLHFSRDAVAGTKWVAADKDVIVLRTFSKLYGMAGLRAGAALGRPDLLEKLRAGYGLAILPSTGMAGAIASLKVKDLVSQRRKIVADIREDLFAWMDKKGYSYIRSDANMVMVDGKRPGRELGRAMLRSNVAIGRSWPSLPNHARVTIGTAEEMARFKVAFDRVMQA